MYNRLLLIMIVLLLIGCNMENAELKGKICFTVKSVDVKKDENLYLIDLEDKKTWKNPKIISQNTNATYPIFIDNENVFILENNFLTIKKINLTTMKINLIENNISKVLYKSKLYNIIPTYHSQIIHPDYSSMDKIIAIPLKKKPDKEQIWDRIGFYDLQEKKTYIPDKIDFYISNYQEFKFSKDGRSMLFKNNSSELFFYDIKNELLNNFSDLNKKFNRIDRYVFYNTIDRILFKPYEINNWYTCKYDGSDIKFEFSTNNKIYGILGLTNDDRYIYYIYIYDVIGHTKSKICAYDILEDKKIEISKAYYGIYADYIE